MFVSTTYLHPPLSHLLEDGIRKVGPDHTDDANAGAPDEQRGTTVDGEREAARRAAERIRARLAELRGREQDLELHYSLPDPWKRKLFLALCRRYGLKPFREPGRRHSTVQLRAPKAFHQLTLWPEFVALCDELHAHLDELTTRVIREAINEDVSEAAEQSAPPKALPEHTSG